MLGTQRTALQKHSRPQDPYTEVGVIHSLIVNAINFSSHVSHSTIPVHCVPAEILFIP